MPVITSLPSPPSTTDPANFATKADAHVLALQTFTSEINQFGVALSAAGIVTPSRDTVAATATTTNLWNFSLVQDWTGTPTITSLPNAPQPGASRVVYPAAGTVITNNATINVQGNVNFTVSAGDELKITTITTTTFYVTIQRKTGQAVTPTNYANATDTVAGIIELATNAEVQAGTDTVRAVTPAGLFAGLNASGTAPIYACRVWVNFNGTGVVAIRASGNVSSITDNAVGDYTVNFTVALPDANYSTVGTVGDPGNFNNFLGLSRVASPVLTTSVRVEVKNNAATLTDSTYVNVAIFR